MILRHLYYLHDECNFDNSSDGVVHKLGDRSELFGFHSLHKLRARSNIGRHTDGLHLLLVGNSHSVRLSMPIAKAGRL